MRKRFSFGCLMFSDFHFPAERPARLPPPRVFLRRAPRPSRDRQIKIFSLRRSKWESID